MKFLDRLGNVLREGDVVFFAPLQTLVTVTKVQEPTVIEPIKPGLICFEIATPVPQEGKKDAMIQDVMKVHHPGEGASAEDEVNRILQGKGNRPVRVLERQVR